MEYDGAAINKHWGGAWPAVVTDTRDTAHDHSPVLMAPVANLLGEPWYLESDSPGGDFVIWLDMSNGDQVGVSPHKAPDGQMRWLIGLTNSSGQAAGDEHDLLISELPEVVAARVRQFLADRGIEAAPPGVEPA